MACKESRVEAISFDLSWSAETFGLQAKAELSASITGLIGPSGSGKSSLINLLAGLIRPDQGQLVFDGETLIDTSHDIFVPPWKRRFGVIFQESRLWPHQNVLQQIRFGGRHREDDVIELCGLNHLLTRLPSKLSGGEKQRVALARALMSGPRALLMDEPLVSLDSSSRRQLLDVVTALRAAFDIPMVYVTHDVNEALELTDSFLLMHAGTLSGPSPLFELAQRPGHFDMVSTLGLESILLAEVINDDEASGVCRSKAGKWNLSSPRNRAPIGSLIRLGVKPHDVLLGRDVSGRLSAQNTMHGTVTAIRELSNHHIVELDVGQPIVAEVTQDAIRNLEIREGEQVSVIVKSSALRFRGIQKESRFELSVRSDRS